MSVNTNRRWFKVPGINKPADRTLEEQMRGLDRALAAAPGKTVLDLGCAEGLIALEFAKVGAKVTGVEVLDYHLEVALDVCGHRVDLIKHDLNVWSEVESNAWRSEIVLALAVLHKLRDVKRGLELAARSAGNLIVFRWPAWYDIKNGVLRSKHHASAVEVRGVMTREGFALEHRAEGPRGEPVEYWRRMNIGAA